MSGDLLAHPQAGVWRVRLGGVRAGQGYRVEVQAQRPATRPVLRVARPAAGQRLVANPAAPSVMLAGTLSGAPVGSAVSLFYASSPTLRLGGRAVSNTTGTLLADPVPAHNGRWSYRWDTSAVPSGTYYVYARLDNGAGADVVAYAGGTVRVEQPLRPEAPRAVVALALPHSGSLEALWAPPVRAALLVGYRLHWRPLPAHGAHGTSAVSGRWRALDVGRAQSADLAGLEPGRAYQVAVSAYDLEGHESGLATAWTLVLPRLADQTRPTQRRAQRGHAQRGHAPRRQEQHRKLSRRGLPGAAFALGASGIRLVAGGDARLPLLVQPHGRARADGGDYVELTVSGAPDGLLAQPLPGAVDLFAQGQGALAPALQIVTSPTLAPGRYTVRVTARQHLSERVVVARVRVVVTLGATPSSSAGSSARHNSRVGSLQSALVAGTNPLTGEAHGVTHVVAPHAGLRTSRHAVRTARAMRPLTIVRIEPLSVLTRGHGGLRPYLALADTGDDCTVRPSPSTVTYNNAQFPLPGEYQHDANGNIVRDGNRQPVPSTFVKADDLANGFAAADERRLERFRPNLSAPGGYDRPNGQADYGQGYLTTISIPAGTTPPGASAPYPADFQLTAFFGGLDYVPAANSGLPLDGNGQPSGFDTNSYCLQVNGRADCSQVGRATGMVALLTSQSVRGVQGLRFGRTSDPDPQYRAGGGDLPNTPGIVGGIPPRPIPPGSERSRGHLLGWQMGGPAKDPRNFVTQDGPSNSGAQQVRERDVVRAFFASEAQGHIFYSVTPLYDGACVIPYEIDLQAIGDNGWQFSNAGTEGWTSVRDRSQLDTSRAPATVRIDNTRLDNGRLVVPGQSDAADVQCVPPGYVPPHETNDTMTGAASPAMAIAVAFAPRVAHAAVITLATRVSHGQEANRRAGRPSASRQQSERSVITNGNRGLPAGLAAARDASGTGHAGAVGGGGGAPRLPLPRRLQGLHPRLRQRAAGGQLRYPQPHAHTLGRRP